MRLSPFFTSSSVNPVPSSRTRIWKNSFALLFPVHHNNAYLSVIIPGHLKVSPRDGEHREDQGEWVPADQRQIVKGIYHGATEKGGGRLKTGVVSDRRKSPARH